MNIYYCSDCKVFHLSNKKDAMFFDNKDDLK